jgi:two-component system, LytTR family, sensor kinase
LRADDGDTVARREDVGGREFLLVLGFWSFVAALQAATRFLDPRWPELSDRVAAGLVRLSLIEYGLWALLTLPIVWLASRFSVESGKQLGRVLFFLVLGIAVSMSVDAILSAARSGLLPPPRGRGPRPGPAPGFGFLDDFMVYLGVLAAGVARDYFIRYQARREDTVRLQAESSELHAQLAEARLDALRRQLDPHFLFNTLHAISSLVERDPRGVRKMITRLSELLRHTLEGPADQEVPLDKELELLRRYVEIMEIRFQGRLQVSTQVADDVRDALVPNLILQPIVENAVKHGVDKVEGIGRIEIVARRVGENLVLTVRDNGPGPSAVPNGHGGGLGLRNTRDRLSQLYGRGDRFTIGPAEAGGTVAEITLPYHTKR